MWAGKQSVNVPEPRIRTSVRSKKKKKNMNSILKTHKDRHRGALVPTELARVTKEKPLRTQEHESGRKN